MQEYDIPFGRPAVAPAKIMPGEVSPSSQPEVPQTPHMERPHPFSVAAAAAAAAASGRPPEAAAAASTTLYTASPHAASGSAFAAPAAASLAVSSNAASSIGISAGPHQSADGSASQRLQQLAAPDLVEQRSLSLKTVRTGPSEDQQDDSPIVWYVRCESMHDASHSCMERTMTAAAANKALLMQIH